MSFVATVSVSGPPVQHLPERWRGWRRPSATALARVTRSSAPGPLVTLTWVCGAVGKGRALSRPGWIWLAVVLVQLLERFPRAVGLRRGDGVFHICLTRARGLSCCSDQSTRQERVLSPPEAMVITDRGSLATSTPSAIRLERTSARVFDLSKAHCSFYWRFFVKTASAGPWRGAAAPPAGPRPPGGSASPALELLLLGTSAHPPGNPSGLVSSCHGCSRLFQPPIF